MNVLFVTFRDLSLSAGASRSVSVVRALADAGHRVDVIAAKTDMGAHSNIRVLSGNQAKRYSRFGMRWVLLRAMTRNSYQVVHAVDDAVLYIAGLGRLKRAKIVYEAHRIFSGANGRVPSWHWKLFPSHYQRLEKKILRHTTLVLSSCDDLSTDLKRLDEELSIVPVADVPLQSLMPGRAVDRQELFSAFDGEVSFPVVCSVLPGNRNELRTLLLAARKVIEKVPHAGFFFKGVSSGEAQSLASSLEIQGRCVFMDSDDPERCLAALSMSSAALFVPQPGGRYIDPEILTLLKSPALVVAVHEGAYLSVLSDQNSISVDYTATSIAEGLLRVVQEPLLTYGIVTAAHTLVAERYSYSSFKHKIRMTYRELVNTHYE